MGRGVCLFCAALMGIASTTTTSRWASCDHPDGVGAASMTTSARATVSTAGVSGGTEDAADDVGESLGADGEEPADDASTSAMKACMCARKSSLMGASSAASAENDGGEESQSSADGMDGKSKMSISVFIVVSKTGE